MALCKDRAITKRTELNHNYNDAQYDLNHDLLSCCRQIFTCRKLISLTRISLRLVMDGRITCYFGF